MLLGRSRRLTRRAMGFIASGPNQNNQQWQNTKHGRETNRHSSILAKENGRSIQSGRSIRLVIMRLPILITLNEDGDRGAGVIGFVAFSDLVINIGDRLDGVIAFFHTGCIPIQCYRHG